MDHQPLWQVFGVHLKQGDFDHGLTPAAVEFQLERVYAAAVNHHEVSRPAVADIAAAALNLHKHVVSGRLSERIDGVVSHENEIRTYSCLRSRQQFFIKVADLMPIHPSVREFVVVVPSRLGVRIVCPAIVEAHEHGGAVVVFVR